VSQVLRTRNSEGAISDLRSRLHREYDPRVGADQVEATVTECTHHFDRARITMFVPVLVEKSGRDRLRAATTVTRPA
jgi:hypothetical protein